MMKKAGKVFAVFFTVLMLLSLFVVAPVFAVEVDWWNSCEDEDEWDYYNGATGSIDTSIHQEGSGCLEINVPDTSTGLRAILDGISHTELYFGFWIRREANLNVQTYIYDSTNSYYITIFKSGTDKFQWAVSDDGGSGGQTSTIDWNADTWYWVEVLHTGGSYYFRVNGASAGSYLGSGTYWKYEEFRFSTGLSGASNLKLYLDYLRIADGWEYPPGEPPFIYFDIVIDLEDVDDDGADWVFTDWRYYTFNITTNSTDLDDNSIENVSMYFTVPTGVEDIVVSFFSDGDEWIYESNMTIEHREGEPVQLRSGSWSENATHISVTFLIWFNSRVLDVWEPDDGVSVYGAYNSCAWFLAETDLFRIYSEGGFEMNTNATGNAGKLTGGSPFSLYAYNGSSAYNEVWYRDGQHIKLLPDVHFLAGLEDFSVYYGIDYSLGNGEWESGLMLIIAVDFVSYTGIFASNVWINMTVSFWNRGSYISNEDLYMFYHGSVSSQGDSGHWLFWVDLWFSDKNASSVISGRINAFEYPMNDNADAWLRWLASNWGVKDDVLKEFAAEGSLLDSNDATVISSEKTVMMRFWSNLTVGDLDAGQSVYIMPVEVFDVTHSRLLPLTGMSAPVFDETKIPTVGQTGILGALWSLFAGLGQWISDNILFGGLDLWGTFVNFLDTIAGLIGAPKFFTNLFTWISEQLSNMVDSFGYVGTVISAIFTLFGELLGAFLTYVAELITGFVNLLAAIGDIMTGTVGAGLDLWDSLGILQWLSLAIILYPMYLVFLWEDEGLDAVIRQLSWIFGILSWLFHFFIAIIQFVIGLITALIESIPIAE